MIWLGHHSEHFEVVVSSGLESPTITQPKYCSESRAMCTSGLAKTFSGKYTLQ